jgi:hypothetical protein
MRGLVIVLLACVVLNAPLSASATPPMFRMEPLPELAGLESSAQCGRADSLRGIDVAGWSRGANGIERAVMWHLADRDCTVVPPPIVLPVLDPIQPSWVNDLIRPANSDCTAIYLCGRSVNMGGIGKPALWRCPGGAAPCTLFVLPTLVPGGVGEANSITQDITVNKLVGTSRNAASIPKACMWEPSGGSWTIGALPHPMTSSEGAALHIVAPDESTLVIAGFAENESGLMRPQIWKRIGAGPWVRTELPLLAGGTEGAGVGARVKQSGEHVVAGWSNDASGNRIAARWEEVSPGQWSITNLGMLPGTIASEALGETGVEGVETYWNAGSSYNESPGSDGLATLWEVSYPVVTAYDVNSLVVGDRPLLASIVVPTLSFKGGSGNDSFSGTGRSPDALRASGGGAAQHALLLIEATDVGVVPPVSGQGRRVATVVDDFFTAGRHEASWPARDGDGDLIGPGVYVLRLETGGVVTSQKVVQIR